MAGPASRGARLMYVLLLQRDVPAATRFYKDGLGLAVTAASPTWAQVRRRSAPAPAAEAEPRGPPGGLTGRRRGARPRSWRTAGAAGWGWR